MCCTNYWLQIIIMRYVHCTKCAQTPESKQLRRSELLIFGNVFTKIKTAGTSHIEQIRVE